MKVFTEKAQPRFCFLHPISKDHDLFSFVLFVAPSTHLNPKSWTMFERKNSSSRKDTTCSQCTRSFWYIDPRPGGRPRQKCGICSSRPPRYPWGFLDGEPNEFGQETPFTKDAGHKVKPDASPSSLRNLNRHLNNDESAHRVFTDEALANPYPMPSPYTEARAEQRFEQAESFEQRLTRIEQRLDGFDERLSAIEQALNVRQEGGVNRSDWVDLCARLDIVEQLTVEALGEVKTRLEKFGKDVKQVAVVPERQLNEMFELIKVIRKYNMPDSQGNR